MKRYTTNSIVSLHAGEIKLTEAQASVRSGKLERIGKSNVYAITDTIYFKAGETFEYDGELSRVEAACLDEAGKKETIDIEVLTSEATEKWNNNEKKGFRDQFPTVESFVEKYIADKTK